MRERPLRRGSPAPKPPGPRLSRRPRRGEGLRQARQWAELADSQGNTNATVALFQIYFNGWGVPKDFKKAAEYAERGEAAGNRSSIFFRGFLYWNGFYYPKDSDKALPFFQRAAQLGEIDGWLWAGHYYQWKYDDAEANHRPAGFYREEALYCYAKAHYMGNYEFGDKEAWHGDRQPRRPWLRRSGRHQDPAGGGRRGGGRSARAVSRGAPSTGGPERQAGAEVPLADRPGESFVAVIAPEVPRTTSPVRDERLGRSLQHGHNSPLVSPACRATPESVHFDSQVVWSPRLMEAAFRFSYLRRTGLARSRIYGGTHRGAASFA